ncbi:MAG: NAD(P)-binding domain-containing protein [Chloroflexi bacterium]|nr:NAD(P)-binding domain-containing protein [Chloroflexota bacterium]
MEIGILGTGMVGQTIGSKLVQLGHDVFMGARDADNPKAIAWAKKEEGQRALYGTFTNAAAFGEIIFNCTLGSASLDALHQAGAGNLKNKILIDTSNPIDYTKEDLILSVCNGDSLGEQIQRAFPETRVVKTLNTMNCNMMVEPAKLPERTNVFVSGNDIDAKTTVIGILREWFGWKSVIDLGNITTSRGVEMLLPLWFSLRRVVPSDRFNIRVISS